MIAKTLKTTGVVLFVWVFFALHDLVQYELILKDMLPSKNQYDSGSTYGAVVGYALGHCFLTVAVVLVALRQRWNEWLIPLVAMGFSFVTASTNYAGPDDGKLAVYALTLILAGIWGTAFSFIVASMRRKQAKIATS